MNCIKEGKYTGDSCLGCCVKVEDCEIRDKVYRKRWIPVSERLPEHNNKILVCNPFRVTLGHYNKFFQGFYYDDGNEIGYVLAWQPLPEPYEENEVIY